MQKPILFSMPSCPKCDLAKEKLINSGIKYDVSQDVNAATALGIKTVPALYENGTIYSLKEILKMCEEKGKEQ